jgi:DNA-binding NarL/FixJ family response regulator
MSTFKIDTFKIDTEWENPMDASGETLRQTWARISIHIKNECITEFYDIQRGYVKTAVYGPTYPLAEWICLNWWALTQEAERPIPNINQRHNIKYAREGFALPNLTFFPQGNWVKASWKPFTLSSQSGRFITQPGKTTIPTKDFIAELQNFVDKTVRKLEDKGIKESPLQNIWKTLKISQRDPAETKFCEIAGKLGLDPYEIQELTSDQIIQAHKILPKTLRDEFFQAANPNQIINEAQKITEISKNIRISTHKPQFPEFRLQPQEPAWNTGYRLAKTIKEHGISYKSLKKAIRLKQTDIGTFNGLAHFNGKITIYHTTPKTKTSQAFLIGQAICEQLTQREPLALLTSAKTPRQARNRAFAAEMLAPAQQIQEKLNQGLTDSEIADELKVSPYVIEYQKENHRLAEIA